MVYKQTIGSKSDCKFDANYKVSGPGCNNYVLIIQDKHAYPDDIDVQQLLDPTSNTNDDYFYVQEAIFNDGEHGINSGWKYIPDVFLSGSVHGNERVGPSSLLEMSELLVESAYCESLPRMHYKPKDENDAEGNKRWEQEIMSAKACREDLQNNKGVPSEYRQWLARLVSTRRTVVIPTANALGYSRNERAEDSIDPNRDFPFDIEQTKTDTCMQTIAGRSINELFRSHLFPIGLTFHGGMEVIGYEWGAPTYLNKDAPGEVAQRTIASAYSRYANGFKGHTPYDFGTMNDKVYYVRGGMEDWAFAGSWDPDRVVTCTPKTYNGYPPEKTQYNNSTLRAFNMLIETSDPKEPKRAELGKRTQPLISSNGAENGHVARNIRLALLAVDVVEPYVTIRGVEGVELDDDVVPGVNMRKYNEASYFENNKMIWVPPQGSPSSSPITISWTVGGAFNIDSTQLVFGLWDTLPDNLASIEDGTYPSTETLTLINSNVFTATASTQGRSRWHEEGPYPTTTNEDVHPTFTANIDLSSYPPGSKVAVFAKAKVDQDWLQPSANVSPKDLGPVSHIVNARQNPSYYATNAGKVIRGRVDDWWYSDPISIVVGGVNSDQQTEDEVLQEAIANNAPRSVYGDHIKAVHINARLEYLTGAMKSASNTKTNEFEDTGRTLPLDDTTKPTNSTTSMSWMLGTLCIAIILVVLLVAVVRRQRRRRRRDLMERIAQEEDSFTVSSSYRDEYVDETEDSEVELS